MTPASTQNLLYRHHLAIFEAIRDKNAEAAQDAMAAHLTFTEQRGTDYVSQNPPDTPITLHARLIQSDTH